MIPAMEPGEALVWQGGPSRHVIARDVFRIRWVVAYLAVQAVAGVVLACGQPMAAAVHDLAILAVVSGGGLGLLGMLAWLVARTTRITITSARIVLRYGVALPATLDIPFAAIEHIGLRIAADHSGDIAIRLKPGRRVSYLKLWPYARAFRWQRPEPMLRGVPQAAVVGGHLRRTLDHAAAVRARSPVRRAA